MGLWPASNVLVSGHLRTTDVLVTGGLPLSANAIATPWCWCLLPAWEALALTSLLRHLEVAAGVLSQGQVLGCLEMVRSVFVLGISPP
jgi:hypothetical protein